MKSLHKAVKSYSMKHIKKSGNKRKMLNKTFIIFNISKWIWDMILLNTTDI